MELREINEAFSEKNDLKMLYDSISNSQESLPISFSKCESFKEIDFLAKTEDNHTSLKTIQVESELIFTSRFNSRQFELIKSHFNTLFTISYPKEFFEKIQNHSYHTIIGSLRNFEVVCFAVLNIDNKNKSAEILSFGVVKEFQGKKFGTRLMRKIIEEMKILAIKEISLIVQATNSVAVSLYQTFGFEIIKEEKNYYFILNGDHRIAYIMRKPIGPEQFWVFKVFRNIARKFLLEFF